MSSQSSETSNASSRPDYSNRDFKILLDVKTGIACSSTNQITVHLVAPTMQEKQAWISDISQVKP